jgi:branched-chain amino acid transport system substrate-binding protein
MRLRFIAACIAAAAGALGLISAASADEKPITIGFAIAQTGWIAPFDNGYKAAELAIAELNAKGGIMGRKIQTIYCDTKADRAQGAKCGLEMVEKGADVVVVTCDYDFGAPAALEAARAGKLSWALCAEDPKMGVQGIGPLAFTGSAAAQLQGSSVAEWGMEKKGWKNAYILLDNTVEYNKSVCYGFELALKAKGGKVVGSDVFKNDDPSIAAQITRLKSTNPQPDVIELCSYPPGGASAVRQIRAAGIKTAIATTTAMDGDYWLDAVPGLTDFYYAVLGSIYGDDPRPEVNELLKKYIAKYNGPPPESHTYVGYSFIQLYSKAVEQAKSTDPKLVTAALESFKNVPTVLGPFSFSKELHIQDKFQFTIMSVDGGKGKHKSVEVWTTQTPLTMNDLFRKAK